MMFVRRVALGLVLVSLLVPVAHAADKAVIDAEVAAALSQLSTVVPGSADVLQRAKGVLVMPSVTKAGFVVGAYYGEGALQIDGKTVDYYSVAGGALGLLAGVESSSQVLVFLTDAALAGFRNANGWEAGATANVTVIQAGTQAQANTASTNQPIIAYVFGQQGLMAGVGLDGYKYTRVER